MGAAYSQDLRDRVMNAIAEGVSMPKAAKQFRVSKKWIQNLKKRLKETGSYAAISTKGRAGRKRVLKNYHKEIQEIVAKEPDATQAEIAEQLPVKVHQSMVGRELRLLKLTYKKNGLCCRTRPSRCRRKASRVEGEATRFEP